LPEALGESEGAGDRPVDPARRASLETRILDRLDASSAADASPRPGGAARVVLSRIRAPWWRIAAALVLVAAVALATLRPASSAVAVELTDLHRDVVAGRLQLTSVDTVDAANAWIARQDADGPALPDFAADLRVRSCCLAEVEGTLVAVALLRDVGEDITLVVADAPRVAHPMGTRHVVDGRSIFTHRMNGLNMATWSAAGRWVCVMGEAGSARLVEIAAAVSLDADGDGRSRDAD
jgi:hypothetical protein